MVTFAGVIYLRVPFVECGCGAHQALEFCAVMVHANKPTGSGLHVDILC